MAKGKKKKGKKKHKQVDVCANATGSCRPKCTVDSELVCGTGKICQGGTCVPGCRNDSYCRVVSATHVEVCENGQCVKGCLNNDFQCPDGKVCAANYHCVPLPCETHDDCAKDRWCDTALGLCRRGCRTHSDCPDCHLCDMYEGGTHQCYIYDQHCCEISDAC